MRPECQSFGSEAKEKPGDEKEEGGDAHQPPHPIASVPPGAMGSDGACQGRIGGQGRVQEDAAMA
jgi:hypothetical protein